MAGSAIVGTLRALLTLDTANFEKAAVRVGKQTDKWTKQWASLGRQASDLGRTLTGALTVPMVGMAAGAAKLAIDFESSFAGVRKTVNATEDQFAELAQGFRNLAKTIPVNVNELNRIGEAAGQLGIKTENILGFTEVMAKLGVTTNLSADQAAESLARLANITQMPQSAFDRLGSTIVALGNNFAAKEAEIVEFGLRIAGAGAQVGLAEAEILAFGTALSSVGINAEAGGTAISKVFIELASRVGEGGQKLEQVAAIAGMTGNAFREAFAENAAMATTAFVEGLGRVRTEGGNVFAVIEDLGMSEIRLRDALLRASGAGDVLRRSLELGNEAWSENNALTKEAEERFRTTEQQIKLFWNRLQDVGITLGGTLVPILHRVLDAAASMLPALEAVVNAFAAMPAPVQTVIAGVAAFGAAIGPVLWALGAMTTGITTVVRAFGSKGIATAALTGKLGALGSTLSVLATRAIPAVGAAMAGWNIGKWLRDIGAMGDASETASQQIERLGLRALTLGERAEFLAARFQTMFTGNFVSDEDLMLGILSRRQAALEDLGEAVDETSQKELTAAERNLEAQRALTRSAEDLALQIGHLEGAGESSATVLANLGQSAVTARDQAKALGLSLDVLPPSVLALADAYDQQAAHARTAAQATEDKRAADEAARRAAEQATAAVEAQTGALRSLGIITRQDVTDEIQRLQGALTAAAREGAGPLQKAAETMITRLKDLRAAAIKSGQSVDDIDAELAALRRTVRELNGDVPTLTNKIMSLSDANRILAQHTGVVTGEQMRARTEAALLESAYETLGVETSASLHRAAEAARIAYERILASGLATEEELKQARLRLEQAELEAGLRTVSLWETQIAPAVQMAGRAIVDSMAVNFTDMLTGAASFKEGFTAIWSDLKDAVRSILDSLLRTFIGEFLGGMLEALGGWARKAGQIIGSVFSMGNAGIGGLPMIPGLSAPAVGGGGAAATGGGIAASAGLAIGLTAASVAPIAIPWAMAAFGPHGNDAQASAQMEIDALLEGLAYQGLTLEQGIERGLLDGLSFDAQQILGLADGGIVLPQPGGSVFRLAEAGVPEAVIPLSQFDVGGTMQIILQRDGQRDAEWLMPFMPGARERLGV